MIILIQVIGLVLMFVFGTAVGSFLNVVIYRYQTGATVVNDRSRCMSCGTTLSARMLVPILSFVIQGGRCAYCETRLSWQYPIVELLGGALALAVALKTGIFFHAPTILSVLDTVADLVFLWMLLVITVYDLKHKIIPDQFSILLFVFAAIHAGISIFSGATHILPTLLTSIGIALPFALLWLASSGRWMGLGDAKLALGLGMFLGYPIGASIPVIAFWIGTIPALVLLLLSKRITMKSEIPFAPFLALATLLLYVYPIDIFQLHSILAHVVP